MLSSIPFFKLFTTGSDQSWTFEKNSDLTISVTPAKESWAGRLISALGDFPLFRLIPRVRSELNAKHSYLVSFIEALQVGAAKLDGKNQLAIDLSIELSDLNRMESKGRPTHISLQKANDFADALKHGLEKVRQIEQRAVRVIQEAPAVAISSGDRQTGQDLAQASSRDRASSTGTSADTKVSVDKTDSAAVRTFCDDVDKHSNEAASTRTSAHTKVSGDKTNFTALLTYWEKLGEHSNEAASTRTSAHTKVSIDKTNLTAARRFWNELNSKHSNEAALGHEGGRPRPASPAASSDSTSSSPSHAIGKQLPAVQARDTALPPFSGDYTPSSNISMKEADAAPAPAMPYMRPRPAIG